MRPSSLPGKMMVLIIWLSSVMLFLYLLCSVCNARRRRCCCNFRWECCFCAFFTFVHCPRTFTLFFCSQSRTWDGDVLSSSGPVYKSLHLVWAAGVRNDRVGHDFALGRHKEKVGIRLVRTEIAWEQILTANRIKLAVASSQMPRRGD